MAATIYRSTDAGTPAWPTTYQETPKFFMDVIKACLVDGYGAKSGAGWSLVYEDTTAEAERLAISNGNGVIEFVSWNRRALGIFLWDSITTPGVGSIYNDSWASVVSEGVNGWKGEQTPAPGSSGDLLASLYTFYLYNADYQFWEIHADDKSVWVSFEYPSGNSLAEPGDTVARYTYSPLLFFGAVDSPDLARSGAGNFFLGHSGQALPASATPTGGNNSVITRVFGLRTPMDTVPSVGNNPEFTLSDWGFGPYHDNHMSSVRPILPVLLSYNGTDVPRDASLAQNQADYQFARFPGVGWFCENDTFWELYTAEHSSTWLYEPLAIGGKTWRPLQIEGSACYGITDDADWWT